MASTRLGFRPEIEGLRALAVALVVLDHLFGWPRAGFVGVDVFFVVSGYLITGLLTNEFARTGRLSIVGFYRRRARRILPNALLVLAATWVASELLLKGARAHQSAVDVLWALGFAANVHFAAVDTNYFQAGRPPSPVQHFWSLAVEEQFYVVWPLALVLVLMACRRLARTRAHRIAERAPAAVVMLLFAGLFLWALRLTAADSAAAYFATPARAWELAAGAVLALAVSHPVPMPRVVAELLLLGGLVTVVVAGFTTPALDGFPAPAALPAVAGAAAIVLGSCAHRPTLAGRALTNPVARYLGRVSYALYLWHWPVIVLVPAVLSGGTGYLRTVELLLMTALTLLSYTFVEQPFRRRGLAVLRRADRRRGPRRYHARLSSTGWVSVTVVACLLLAFTVYNTQPLRAVRTFAVDAEQNARPSADRPYGEVQPPATLAKAINTALGARSFPALDPSIADLPSAFGPEWTRCRDIESDTLGQCTFPGRAGRPKRTLVIIGDSVAITWLPALRQLQQRGYTVYGLTYGQCPAAQLDVKPSVGNASQFTRTCNRHRDFAIATVARLKPDVVVLENSPETLGRLASGATGAAADREWQGAVETTVRRVQAAGAQRTVLLGPVPEAANMQECGSSSASTPGDCVSQLSDTWYGEVAAETAAAKATGIAYLDLRLLFCATNNYCPSFVGTTPVRVDGLHPTDGFSTLVGPIIDPLIIGGTR